jgi:hypothetical protein
MTSSASPGHAKVIYKMLPFGVFTLLFFFIARISLHILPVSHVYDREMLGLAFFVQEVCGECRFGPFQKHSLLSLDKMLLFTCMCTLTLSFLPADIPIGTGWKALRFEMLF